MNDATGRITEHKVHEARQTHEIVQLQGLPVLVLSQMMPSTLVKIGLDTRTQQITETCAFPIHEPDSMLHGLATSTRYPGHIWATLQGANLLLLIDPGIDLAAAPMIVRTIPVPAGGRGPHYVGEYGDLLCVSLKDSNQVLNISHIDESDYTLYDALPQPVFVAVHPESGEIYASQDKSSSILRINREAGTATQIGIPPERGDTPVGLIPGPLGVWFVLLGSPPSGAGTFGRIGADGEIDWYKLTSHEGEKIGLLHLAFDPPRSEARGVWLLSSSIGSPDVLDALIRVTFDDEYTNLESQSVSILPTQTCMAHRVLPLHTSSGVVVTEMTTSTVAQLTY